MLTAKWPPFSGSTITTYRALYVVAILSANLPSLSGCAKYKTNDSILCRREVATIWRLHKPIIVQVGYGIAAL
jgi:hypothetical protein